MKRRKQFALSNACKQCYRARAMCTNELLLVQLMDAKNFPTKSTPTSSNKYAVQNWLRGPSSSRSSTNVQLMIAVSFRDRTPNQNAKAKKFVSKQGSTGKSNVMLHKINSEDTRLIRQRPKRLPWVKREEAEKMIKDLTNQGGIKPPNSP